VNVSCRKHAANGQIWTERVLAAERGNLIIGWPENIVVN
jgi:hypothetical protein